MDVGGWPCGDGSELFQPCKQHVQRAQDGGAVVQLLSQQRGQAQGLLGRSHFSLQHDGCVAPAWWAADAVSSDPNCYQAQLLWQHGNYTINPKTNEITLDPFNPDGRQQISEPCSGKSDRIEWYGQSEKMKGYDITTYLHMGESRYRLQLYNFDGSLKTPMYLYKDPPDMYPTKSLHMKVVGLM